MTIDRKKVKKKAKKILNDVKEIKKEIKMEKEFEKEIDEKVNNEEAEDVVEETTEEVAAEENATEESSEENADESEEASETEEKPSKKDKKDEKIAELEDRVKRQMAEFENFRKRTEKEKSSMYEMGAKSVIEKMLPIVDNFERGLASIPADQKESAVSQGMHMIYKQIMTEFENMGVKPIEAVGKEFDPELHNAVMQVESEEYETGIVASELQKGYTYRDGVVRHSMVAVVQ